MLITVNGREIAVEQGQTVLEAARGEGIWIPTLCSHQGLEAYGACRLCLVEIVSGGRRTVTASCTLPVSGGLVVETDTPRVRQAREMVMQLHLAAAPDAPRVQELARQLGVVRQGLARHGDGRCILCGLCVRACRLVGANAIGFAFRGSRRRVTAPFAAQAVDCLGCRACAEVCPTGAVAFSEAGERLCQVGWTGQGAPWQPGVELARCASCGRPYTPRPLSGYLQRRYGLDFEGVDTCPECRRRLAGSRLATGAGRPAP